MDRLLRIIDLALEKKGLSAAKASRLAVGNSAMIKNMKKGQKPSFIAVEKLFSVLGVSFQFGNYPQISSDSFSKPPAGPGTFSLNKSLPNHGLAKCGIVGWFWDRDDGALPAPDNYAEPDAFYVRGVGRSMAPEGIPTGSYCLVSPNRNVGVGDRVYIIDEGDMVSIKRLIAIDDQSYHLRGWQNPDGGKQQSFDDQRFKHGIKEIWPVVAVFKSRPVAGKKVEYIPDPKADEIGKPEVRGAGWLIPEGSGTIQLYGYAGAGGQIAYDGELHHGEVAPAPPGENKMLAAVEVRGDSAAPFLREGDRIYFDPDFPADPENYIGRLVLATTNDGAAYIKILRRGDSRDKWNLESINPRHPIMEDMELQRISPFVWIHYSGREYPFQKM